MPKTNFVCSTCGYEDIKPGLCPDCSMEMESVCPDCGNAQSECVCEVNHEEDEEEKK